MSFFGADAMMRDALAFFEIRFASGGGGGDIDVGVPVFLPGADDLFSEKIVDGNSGAF